MTGGVTLEVPVEGLPSVYHHIDDWDPLDIRKHLEMCGKGTFISLGIVVDGVAGGTVNFLHEPTEPVNPRARETLVHLTGVHMIFTGPVLFTGVAESKISEIVTTRLSTVET